MLRSTLSSTVLCVLTFTPAGIAQSIEPATEATRARAWIQSGERLLAAGKLQEASRMFDRAEALLDQRDRRRTDAARRGFLAAMETARKQAQAKKAEQDRLREAARRQFLSAVAMARQQADRAKTERAAERRVVERQIDALSKQIESVSQAILELQKAIRDRK